MGRYHHLMSVCACVVFCSLFAGVVSVVEPTDDSGILVMSCSSAQACGANEVCADLHTVRAVAMCPASSICACVQVADGERCTKADDCVADKVCWDIKAGGVVEWPGVCTSPSTCACGAEASQTSTAKPSESVASARISGTMTLSMSDPSKFVADARVIPAIAAALATLVEVSVEHVEVAFNNTSARRLTGAARRLSGTVDIVYAIALPAGALQQVIGKTENIKSRVTAWQPSDVSSAIMAELVSAGAGSYSFEVLIIGAVSVAMTEAPKVGHTGPTASESRSRAVVAPMTAVILLAASPPLG
mmetsp:Transcript_129368/g.374635  ORF Transcript_129368/g.374635 Transcript_129368/m.374635 type:complete len:303 (-) Transcript_129368:265-1173(-)